MRRSIILLLITVWCMPLLWAFSTEDIAFLESEVGQKEYYQNIKRHRIDSIQHTESDTYSQLLAFTMEYQSYSYDTATIFVEKLLDEATHLHSHEKKVEAQVRHAFIFLSSGLFKESADILEDIAHAVISCPREIQADYYITYSRLLYDMADYTHGQLANGYRNQGYRMSEQALLLISPQDTARYWSTAAQYAMKQDDWRLAIERFERALACSTITEHERAIAYSSMGSLYDILGDKKESEHYWLLAAVSDLRSCTKETIAMSMVAQLFYQQGDIDLAARYIQEAMDDATFYNARHRQLSIGKIIPIIEQQQLKALQEKSSRIRHLNICLYLLLAVVFFVIVLLYNRHRALRRTEEAVQQSNLQLTEANRIKEECIATFIYNESNVYSKLEKYQRYVKRKTQERRYDELQSIPQYVDIRILRNEFYKRFDTMFLHIFPDFVEKFNALMRPECKIEMRQGELLNAELRIFALMRLGITDNQQIANLLDYSINTIYTYKTRIKNASLYSTEEFLRRLMLL